MINFRKSTLTVALAIAVLSTGAPSTATASAAALTTGRPVTSQGGHAIAATVARNLKTFTTYDFEVFNNQDWSRVSESHASNIVVYAPSGAVTKGLANHLKELQYYFIFAPDSRISRHTSAFGAGAMTAVSGVFEGTFTRPMPDGKGGFIPATGKAFKLPITTIARWSHGKIVEKHVYIDVQTFLAQIGLVH